MRIPMKRFSTKPRKEDYLRILPTAPFSFAIISKGEKGFNYAYLPEEIEQKMEKHFTPTK